MLNVSVCVSTELFGLTVALFRLKLDQENPILLCNLRYVDRIIRFRNLND